MTDGLDSVCTYSFTLEELKDLVVLIRKNGSDLPDTMAFFQRWLENELYNNMTLEEAAGFFNEKR